MSDETNPITQETMVETHKETKYGVTLLLLGVILLTTGVFGVAYFQLAGVNMSLAKTVRDLQADVSETKASLSDLKSTLNSAEKNPAPTEALPTELTNLYIQLSNLNALFDRMPLPLPPLKENSEGDSDKVNVQGLPWWKAEWRRTMHTLGKVVIVRYNGGNTPPLVLPEERVFIYQNLHAQMESAMWAVLNRSPGVYQATLMRMHAWITQYFDTKSPTTLAVLEQLQSLAAVPLTMPLANANEVNAPTDASAAQ